MKTILTKIYTVIRISETTVSRFQLLQGSERKFCLLCNYLVFDVWWGVWPLQDMSFWTWWTEERTVTIALCVQIPVPKQCILSICSLIDYKLHESLTHIIFLKKQIQGRQMNDKDPHQSVRTFQSTSAMKLSHTNKDREVSFHWTTL